MAENCKVNDCRKRELVAALEEIERLGWKEGLGAEHAVASHFAIRKIVRKALEQLATD